MQTVQKTGDSMVQFWDGRRHARWCANDRAMVKTVQKTVAFRRCSTLTRWSMSLLLQFIEVLRPCDYAATVSRNWRCLRFSSSPESADIPVATETSMLSAWCGDEGFGVCFFRIFRAFAGCPGVERQFSSPEFFVVEGSPSTISTGTLLT